MRTRTRSHPSRGHIYFICTITFHYTHRLCREIFIFLLPVHANQNKIKCNIALYYWVPTYLLRNFKRNFKHHTTYTVYTHEHFALCVIFKDVDSYIYMCGRLSSSHGTAAL